ncbi:hypothetical protein ABZ897_24030 [Nonomuraea sp. NPDC046802]|uniref:hypothetical protein n=1 Tax=Nonomuraea sp. NPDC046802 TaxID=3154919 RepID=UPI0033E40954
MGQQGAADRRRPVGPAAEAAVAGILTNHVLPTPAGRMPALAERKHKYAEETVDFVLSGYVPETEH